MYTIKYLGKPVLLRELIDTDGLSDSEILGPEILEKVKKFYTKSSKKITKEQTEYYQSLLKIKPKCFTIRGV